MFDPIRLVIHGKPAPQGSKVPVIIKTKRGPVPGLREDSRPGTGWNLWRPRVHDQAQAAARCDCGEPDCLDLRPGYPINEPIEASMVFYFDRPNDHFKGSTKTRAALSVLRPDAPLVPTGSVGDLEKLARAVCDGMQSGQLIADDKLICRYTRLERLFAGPHEQLRRAGAIVWLMPYRPGRLDPRFPDQLAALPAPASGGLFDLLPIHVSDAAPPGEAMIVSKGPPDVPGGPPTWSGARITGIAADRRPDDDNAFGDYDHLA
jgi:Endodeoxyribonuclease RusA